MKKTLGKDIAKSAGRGLGVVLNVLDPISTGNSKESSEKSAQQAFNKALLNVIQQALKDEKRESTKIEFNK